MLTINPGPFALSAMAVHGVVGLAPWAASRAGGFAESRTASPAVWLAMPLDELEQPRCGVRR